MCTCGDHGEAIAPAGQPSSASSNVAASLPMQASNQHRPVREYFVVLGIFYLHYLTSLTFYSGFHKSRTREA